MENDFNARLTSLEVQMQRMQEDFKDVQKGQHEVLRLIQTVELGLQRMDAKADTVFTSQARLEKTQDRLEVKIDATIAAGILAAKAADDARVLAAVELKALEMKSATSTERAAWFTFDKMLAMLAALAAGAGVMFAVVSWLKK